MTTTTTTTTTISERIVLMTQYLNISINDFAKKLGYNRSQALYDVINQKSKPSFYFFDNLYKSEYGNLFSFDWLITGKGTMLKLNSQIKNTAYELENQNYKELCNSQKDLIVMQKREINRMEAEILEFKKTKNVYSGQN